MIPRTFLIATLLAVPLFVSSVSHAQQAGASSGMTDSGATNGTSSTNSNGGTTADPVNIGTDNSVKRSHHAAKSASGSAKNATLAPDPASPNPYGTGSLSNSGTSN